MSETIGATRALTQRFFQLYPDEIARELTGVPVEEALRLLAAEPVERAVDAFARLNPDVATQFLGGMDDELFRRLFTGLDPGHGSTLLARLDPGLRVERLELLPSALAHELAELMDYPVESAGQLMDSRVTAFRVEETVAEALDRIRAHPERRILDLCLVDGDGRLVATVPLQEMAVAQPETRLETLVRGQPISAQATATREDVVDLLEKHMLASLPVVSFEGKLLGIIRHSALVSAAQQDATEDIQAMVGAGREERALSSPMLAIRKRLPWLEINLITAFLAAGVVGLFEDTIARFTALAIYLPVVAGQSGNTGAQALAVTMRGLALREFRPRGWFRVASKEALVGLVNGLAVALTTSTAVYFFTGSIGMPLVLGIAMVLSMVMAGLAGAVIPVILTKLGQDPAQSASIVLTTVTDVVGFLSFLGLATIMWKMFGLAL